MSAIQTSIPLPTRGVFLRYQCGWGSHRCHRPTQWRLRRVRCSRARVAESHRQPIDRVQYQSTSNRSRQ